MRLLAGATAGQERRMDQTGCVVVSQATEKPCGFRSHSSRSPACPSPRRRPAVAAAAAGAEAIPPVGRLLGALRTSSQEGPKMKCVRFALVLLTPMLLARCSSGNADRAPIEWQKVPGLGPNGS